MIQNSNSIHSCYRVNEPTYYSTTPGYRKEYYLLHREDLINRSKQYYQHHKKRMRQKKSIWFQKNKERLRKKHGFIRRYETKKKDIPITEIIKKNIILTFD